MLRRILIKDIDTDLKKVENYLHSSINSSNRRFESSLRYLLESGGKRIRPAFTLLAARYGREDTESIVPLAAALELVHMASLIHDDVVDSSDLRRGRPTVRKLYGNDFSLHLGVYLFARAISIIGEYKNKELNSMLALAGIKMCRGEIEQLAEAYSFQTDIQQYLYNIKRKTASLVTVSCVAGAVAGGAEPLTIKALRRYGHYLGMAYQITDDVLDYTTDEKTLGKPVGSDVKNGVITLPVIYVLKYGEDAAKREVLEILNKKTFNVQEVKRITEIVTDTEALDFSMSVANKYVEKALSAADNLPNNRITDIFKEIAGSIYTRKY